MRWKDEATGYECMIKEGFGRILCGYVGVERDHPLYDGNPEDWNDFEVHGGVTFAGHWDDDCVLWWIGFDCGHCFDIVPGMLAVDIESERAVEISPGIELIINTINSLKLFEGATYKDINYVLSETIDLARQIRDSVNQLPAPDHEEEDDNG